MDKLKKAGYRTVQTALKASIPVLPYRTPDLYESVADVPFVLKGEEIERVLIVTDEPLYQLGATKGLEAALEENGIAYYIYNRVVPNPTLANVEEALRLYHRRKCQGLIGFGGGSAIDCAKAVGARVARPHKSLKKMRGILQVRRPIPYLMAIPTTAGTGSETTLATVIVDDRTGDKFAIMDFPLIPRAAVLDAELLKTLPPFLVATTGMDALTHAVEAYIGRSSVRASRKDALLAVALIHKNLRRAYENGGDMVAKRNMLKAAFHAGRAFSMSYVGYCHAVAHSLGGKYHIPHGLANAVLLPYVLEGYGEAIYPKAKDLAVAMGLVQERVSERAATLALIRWIRETNCAMGIPEKLAGIQKADIPQLARHAEKEANPLYPVPVLMNAKQLETFFYDVMEE